jgi:transposase
MARYKDYDYSQGKFIPIHFDRQMLPGTFEYSLHYLIDNEIDLSIFDTRYRNDETGAPAYDPAILLKIILYAYSRGITSSRKIEQCCRENVILTALSADTQPHFATISDFISSSGQEIIHPFLEILMRCLRKSETHSRQRVSYRGEYKMRSWRRGLMPILRIRSFGSGTPGFPTLTNTKSDLEKRGPSTTGRRTYRDRAGTLR